MIVLGIETSCDETGICFLKAKDFKVKILANLISSQTKLHEKYGGVFPSLAKREHKKNLPILFERAKKISKVKKIDLIGVTVGPGLDPCLWEGINFAKKIKSAFKSIAIGINHIEAHILINFLKKGKILISKKFFPAICLVVSGGHTQLILMKEIGEYKILGETRDDAAGECLDKVARILGFSYPGGPKLEKLAKSQIPDTKFQLQFPRPMIFQKNYDFSFSGLKTAVLYDFLKRKEKERESKEYKAKVAKEVQDAIFDVLIFKTKRALKEFFAKSLILGGGVVANEILRKRIKREIKKEFWQLKVFMPSKRNCTDNGLMVAFCAYLNFLNSKGKKVLKAFPDLKI